MSRQKGFVMRFWNTRFGRTSTCNRLTFLLIAAVVNPVCIKEEDVTGTHECDFCHVRGVHFPCPERYRKVLVPVRIVLGNFQSERKELHHASLIDLHEPFVFCRRYQRWWVAEIYKTERSTGTYLTVEHGGDFARIVIFIPSQGVPRGDGLCEPKINLLEEIGCCFSVPIQFGKHECMKSVVYG